MYSEAYPFKTYKEAADYAIALLKGPDEIINITIQNVGGWYALQYLILDEGEEEG